MITDHCMFDDLAEDVNGIELLPNLSEKLEKLVVAHKKGIEKSVQKSDLAIIQRNWRYLKPKHIIMIT